MKVFVTGATGFLGSHLVDRLLKKGVEVHALIRKSSNLRWLVGKKVRYHYGDVIGESKGLREGLEGADVVYHVAGVVRAREAKIYYKVNAHGTANVLQACLEVNPQVKRVVVVTSVAAHGPNDGVRMATEGDECRPLTDYGKSKRDAELITLRYVDKLPISIVRPPAIYGPRDDQVLQFFRMVKKGVVLLPGGGRRVLNLCHAADVVTGLLLAAEHPKGEGEIFFVGEDRNYDWEEAANTIAQAVRRHPIMIRVPKALVFSIAAAAEGLGWMSGRVFPLNLAQAKNFMQKNWALDISKAKRLLGFQPAYSLASGAEETAVWYEKEGWL